MHQGSALSPLLLMVCRPNVASGVVVVVVRNRSQMRTSKCTCLMFGVLTLARNAQKDFLIDQSSRTTRHIAHHLWMASRLRLSWKPYLENLELLYHES